MIQVTIRKARREDCPEILRLIKELAEYEKMPDCVKINSNNLEKDGFDSNNPPFQCLVIEDPRTIEGGDTKLVGFALYSIIYGTWEGKWFWLEDIMVTEEYRGKGLGNQLLSALCKEAMEEGVVAIRFVVLKWNPANEFYKKHGVIDITQKEDWHYSKMDYADIVKCATAY